MPSNLKLRFQRDKRTCGKAASGSFGDSKATSTHASSSAFSPAHRRCGTMLY
jgi:hypothetical protein